MKLEKRKTVGILGGLGPEATIELYRLIFAYSVSRGARTDQEHLETVISSIPATPDRDLAVREGSDAPVNELVRSARRLEAAGVDFIVIACNSAHYFLEQIRAAVGITVINMIEIVASAINGAGVKKAGLLATDGTLYGKLYDRELAKLHIQLLKPDRHDQEHYVNRAVFGPSGIKAGFTEGEPKELIRTAALRLIDEGAEAIIVACTDISLVVDKEMVRQPVIDSLEELAKFTVQYAYR